MEGQGDSAPSMESFRYRHKEERPSQNPSKPKYPRSVRRGWKKVLSAFHRQVGLGGPGRPEMLPLAMQAACREACSGVCCQSSTRAPSQAQPGAPQINTVSFSPPQGCTDRLADIEKTSRGAQKGIIYD